MDDENHETKLHRLIFIIKKSWNRNRKSYSIYTINFF